MNISSAARPPNISPMTSIRMPAKTAPPYPLLNILKLVTMPLDTQDANIARMQNHATKYKATITVIISKLYSTIMP